jgi:hypothetical protein
MMHHLSVTASSGSSGSEDKFLKPRRPAAIAGETEVQGPGQMKHQRDPKKLIFQDLGKELFDKLQSANNKGWMVFG